MKTNSEHINNLFKQKFEDFAPQPPERVWANITSVLDKETVPVWYNTLMAKIIAVLLGVIVIYGGYQLFKQKPQADNNQKEVSVYQNTSISKAAINNKNDKRIGEPTINSQQSRNTENGKNKNDVNKLGTVSAPATTSPTQNLQNTPVLDTPENASNSSDSPIALIKKEKPTNSVININLTETVAGIEKIQSKSVVFSNPITPSPLNSVSSDVNPQNFTVKKQFGKWVLGFYFEPEFIFDSFDSLTIQNSYALKVEPTYYINNHWFIRPSVGVSYVRDKGFVKANYLSWDYLGSYEDVVDVTFDTSGNTVTPIYHTQTKEVYDSILHFSVSEETNRYLYLQTSLVFGYHNHVNKFGWSIYAGPQVNFILTEKRDNPVKENTSVIYLNYNLPQRRSPQYGLKLGVGVDYTIAKKWLITVEPEYHYFFNGINGGDAYSKPLSGIGLRFGLIYTIK